MNNHYKTLIAILAMLMDEHDWTGWIMQALSDAGTPYAKSRVQGWRYSPAHKNYRHMTNDEFLDVLNAIYRTLNNAH